MTSSDDFRALYHFSPAMKSPRLNELSYYDMYSPVDDEKPHRSSIQSMEPSDLSYIDESKEDDDLLAMSESDVEAQIQQQQQPSPPPAEYSVSTSRKLTYLGLYFVLNLSVTLSNKALLRSASFPWLLTFSHTFSTSIGCALLLATGQLKLSKLTLSENLTLVAFSLLFTLNIAISNVSLALVSVPFHQVMRSTCPVVTILIYRLAYSRTYSMQTYMSMIPLVIGVGLATLGDYYFTLAGFLLTLLGVLLASIKTVATNRLMTGSLKLSAMEVLLRMSPLAAIQCLFYAAGSGEITQIRRAFAASSSEGLFTPTFFAMICVNAVMAFGLNLVSFQANKVAGALTMSVCGNVKQTLTILLGIVLFNVRIAPLNGAGMVVAVAGAAYYSKVELDRKRAASSG